MTYQNQLEESYLKLQKLKANIHTQALLEYVDKVKKVWKPKTKQFTGMHYHGSKSGDEETVTLYFDEYSLEWTTEEMAFRGYLFNKVKEVLNKNKIKKYK